MRKQAPRQPGNRVTGQEQQLTKQRASPRSVVAFGTWPAMENWPFCWHRYNTCSSGYHRRHDHHHHCDRVCLVATWAMTALSSGYIHCMPIEIRLGFQFFPLFFIILYSLKKAKRKTA